MLSSSSSTPLPPPRDFSRSPREADFKWARDSYSEAQRTLDTWAFFASFRARLWLLDQKWSYPGGYDDAKRSERSRSLARYLLTSVLDLGPTFIKVGQLASTRSDLFDAVFVQELATLQDAGDFFGFFWCRVSPRA